MSRFSAGENQKPSMALLYWGDSQISGKRKIYKYYKREDISRGKWEDIFFCNLG